MARCHAIADALRKLGAETTFLCRHLAKGAQNRLNAVGHDVVLIDGGGIADELMHSSWLAGSQADDAVASRAATAAKRPDWIVVDHYALDFRWEQVWRNDPVRILVIDDLADRRHECDVLLDQNLTESSWNRYEGLVPRATQLLLGPRYALLRPSFKANARTRDGTVRRLLVFFGGVDAANQTGRVLRLLPGALPSSVHVDVVIGAAHPNQEEIAATCAKCGYICHVQTDKMAELMSAADLSIGGGGTAIWERCCVGLPSLVWPQAENQRDQVRVADKAGVVVVPDLVATDDLELQGQIAKLCRSPQLLRRMSITALELVDGEGVSRVCRALGFEPGRRGNF